MFRLFLLLNPVYVTLFWSVALNLVRRKGNEPKWFLGKFMIVSLILFLSHLLYYFPLPEIYIYVDPFYHLAHLSVFPLYYIYVRLLAKDVKFSLPHHYRHLIPPVVMFLLYSVGLFFLSKEARIGLAYNSTLKDEAIGFFFLYQKIMTYFVNLLFIIQGIFYMTLSILAVRRNYSRVADFYSNSENPLLKVQLLNISMSVTMGSCIVMEIINRANFSGGSAHLIIPSLLLTIMLFWIGFLGSRQRQLLLTDEEDCIDIDIDVDETVSDNALSPQLKKLKSEIQILFEKEHIYLNENLTIYDVVKRVGSNRSYVSRVINSNFGLNFSQFVNCYRLGHARTLFAKNPNMSKEEIAAQSGFGSAKSMRRVWQAYNAGSIKPICGELTD